MKLGKCEAWNFGSYSHIEFDMADIGLSLVYGKTGSGKSMLADLPCWCLYGITAKNGAADEVRSWQTPDQPTKGILDVQLPGGNITVTRIRGRSSQNDLYWTEGADDRQIRGKDINDTQRQLSNRLGVDSTLYLSASYFCDFSPSGQFFVAKAKDRRELFEKIASLDLPVKLGEKTSEARKAAKKELEKSEMDLAKASGRLEQINESYNELQRAHDSWAEKHREQVKVLTASVNPKEVAFIKEELKELEALKPELRRALQALEAARRVAAVHNSEFAKLSKIGHECPTCLSPQANNTHRIEMLAALKIDIKLDARAVDECKAKVDRFESAMEKEDGLENDLRLLNRAQADLDALPKENPFSPQMGKAATGLTDIVKLTRRLGKDVDALNQKVARLTRLYDLSFELRNELLSKAVKQLETSTNSYLEKYFDAEIRVSFASTDDLDVTIQKSGFECSFRQLSKGQRRLLTLCFSIAVMEASANAAGVHFDNMWFDEALDGCDNDMKIKAFRLFEDIASEHGTVMVIDHCPELQSMFPTKYKVELESDSSVIHENA